jgi:hypothetical protein
MRLAIRVSLLILIFTVLATACPYQVTCSIDGAPMNYVRDFWTSQGHIAEYSHVYRGEKHTVQVPCD